MTQATKDARSILKRVLEIVGLTAGGAVLISAGGDRVFAHQFLTEAPNIAIPDMEYSPQLQIMVRPGSDEPVFGYSQSELRGKANGEYQVAPLVSKVSTSTHCGVTPGGGANGSGPRSGCDSDTAHD
jgi:hypothetical protein